jgi:hypothetical protein
MMLMVMLVMIM